MEDKIGEELTRILTFWGYGAFWGLALYLNQVRKGKRFNLTMFIINMILAGFIGWLADGWLPEDLNARTQLIAISGFLSYPILDLLEDKGFDYFLNKFLWKK